MNFEEWHESQTHEAYQSLDCPHYAWEKAAWNAAIDEAGKVAEDKIEVQPFGEQEEVFNNACYEIAESIKELKE